MFCFQCKQTAKCTGCTGNVGVCGKKADTAQIQDELTGALIGLARATEGNAHMITETTNTVMTKGLAAAHGGGKQDAAAFPALLEKVAAEKQKLVPDCALCAMPCSRTADYDMQNLQEAEDAISK